MEDNMQKDIAPAGAEKEQGLVKGAVILDMSEIDLVGVKTRVSSKKQTNFEDIEAFIAEKREDGTLDALKQLAVADEEGVVKLYGVAMNFGKDDYDYFVGVETKETPDGESGFEQLTVAESQYAMFTASGAAPSSIRECWKKIYNEWFGVVPFNSTGAPELEEWDFTSDRSAEDFKLSVYVPVKRIIKSEKKERPSIMGYVVGGGLGVLTGAVIGNAMGDQRTGIMIGLVAGLILGRVGQKILEDRFRK